MFNPVDIKIGTTIIGTQYDFDKLQLYPTSQQFNVAKFLHEKGVKLLSRDKYGHCFISYN